MTCTNNCYRLLLTLFLHDLSNKYHPIVIAKIYELIKRPTHGSKIQHITDGETLDWAITASLIGKIALIVQWIFNSKSCHKRIYQISTYNCECLNLCANVTSVQRSQPKQLVDGRTWGWTLTSNVFPDLFVNSYQWEWKFSWKPCHKLLHHVSNILVQLQIHEYLHQCECHCMGFKAKKLLMKEWYNKHLQPI